MADVFMGNLQEKLMKNYPNTTNAEIIHFSYFFGFLYLLVFMSITGNLQSGYEAYATENFLIIYGIALVNFVCGYLGVKLILTMVRHFGAFAATAITSKRKALSIFLSFAIFDKPLTANYFYGGIMVFFGVYLNIIAKQKTNANSISKIVMKVLDSFLIIMRIKRN